MFGSSKRKATDHPISEELKQVKNALVASQERYAFLLDSICDYAIISLDTQGVITEWNKGAEEIFKCSADKAIGQNVTLIFTEEDTEHGIHQKEMKVAREAGRALDERWHVRCDGSCIFGSGVTSVVKDEEGQFIGYTKVVRDMTVEKKGAEMLREAHHAAEAANIAKTEFLANMSHEIRTPMNAILGLSRVLSRTSPLTEHQKVCIETLQFSAKTMMELINDLLDIAKIEANRIELEHIDFSLSDLMEGIASMMSLQAQDKDVAVVIHDDAVQGKMYKGDATRIRQIVTNLCSNAVKFTKEGKVQIRVEVEPEADDSKETVVISVSDTGIGIGKDKLNTIFDKFSQADRSINRVFGGTGLGLAISKTLAEAMSGTISVESEEGVGSTFTVRLPLEKVSKHEEASYMQGAHVSSSDAESVKRSLCILLVEDYAPNVLVARLFLEQFGHKLDIAADGYEAVKKFQEQSFDVILMDVQLPQMDGLQATQKIRAYEKEHGLKPIPIVGMTAHAFEEDYQRCLDSGMNDYITKPFDEEVLVEKLAIV